jgi:AraC family transcriptional regulator of adaptative response / DNA-3-methyladenine glycosylase II
VARLRRLLDLDCDVRIVGDHLSRDPRLASSVAARPGLRVPGAWDGFETAVRAILGQQITVSAARQLAGKMAERFGAPLPRSFSRLRRRFPRPEALAGADIESLAMPRARARAVSALAAEVVANPDLLSPVGDLEDNLRRLERLPGIGKWTAQYIAMRVFREPDAFPASDVGLLRSMETTRSGVTVRPSPEELSEMAEAWRPWRAYAAQHLWMKGVDA